MTNLNKKENKENFTTKLSNTQIIWIVIGSIISLLLLFIINDSRGSGRGYSGKGGSYLRITAIAGIPGIIVGVIVILLITGIIKI